MTFSSVDDRLQLSRRIMETQWKTFSANLRENRNHTSHNITL